LNAPHVSLHARALGALSTPHSMRDTSTYTSKYINIASRKQHITDVPEH
jgi:hypothetical protein